MKTHPLVSMVGGVCSVLAIGWFAVGSVATADVQEEAKKAADPETKQESMPQTVSDALMANFPKATIDRWSKETEHDVVVYDIEFTQNEKHFEADIKADGSIHNWEQAIAPTDLPKAVQGAIASGYPKAAIQEVMMITAVADGKDQLEGYEVVMLMPDGSAMEITFAPNGGVLEEDEGDE